MRRRLWTDARQHLQHPKTRHAVARILDPAQHRERVLHVCGFEKLEPAVFHEGNVAADELDLQRRAVGRGAEQHRLLLQGHARLAPRQHRLHDERRLLRLVAHAHQLRPFLRAALAPQRLGVALRGARDHAIGGGENGLRRAVVAFERNDVRRRIELLREIEDVAHGRAAEGIDRLRVVADHGHALPIRLQCPHDLRLQRIGVLVFVDENVSEARADLRGECRFLDHVRPVEQQIIVVEHMLHLLCLDVGAEQALEIVREIGAPGVALREHRGKRHPRVDHRRIDRQTGMLARKAPARLGKPEFVAQQIHEIGSVFAVMDGERRIEADARRVVAQEARADAVESPRPRKLRTRQVRAARTRLMHDVLYTPHHLVGRAARERQQQDRAGIGTPGHQVRHPVGEHIGLARSRAGDH